MYGLFNIGTRTLTRTSADTPEKIASIMLFRIMKEDGINEYTKKTRKEFLDGWADHMNENQFDDRTDHLAEHITDQVADHIVYCNAPHIIELSNMTEVGSEFKKKVFERIGQILTNSIIHSHV